MSLTCSCPVEEGCLWFFETPENFITSDNRRRCSSCKKLIGAGDLCLKFPRWKQDDNGTERSIPPMHMCEACGDQYFNLTELGFCIAPADNVFELLEEYHDLMEEYHDLRKHHET